MVHAVTAYMYVLSPFPLFPSNRLWQVWNPSGVLIGKFFVGSNTANFAFAGDGRLVILAETEIYLVTGLQVDGADLEVIKE